MDFCACLCSTSFSLRTSSPGSEVVTSILRSSITRSQVSASTFPSSNTNSVRQVSLLRTQIFISSSINTAIVNSLCDFETRKIHKLTSVQATTALSHRTQLYLQLTISLFKLPPLRFQLCQYAGQLERPRGIHTPSSLYGSCAGFKGIHSPLLHVLPW